MRVVGIVFLSLFLFPSCGILDDAKEGGKEVVREVGEEAKGLVQETADRSDVGTEFRRSVEEDGFADALSRYWPELAFGQGGILAVLAAVWLGIRKRRRRAGGTATTER